LRSKSLCFRGIEMESQKDKLPDAKDAKDAKVAQKTQKKPKRERFDLRSRLAFREHLIQLTQLIQSMNGIFLRLLRNFCALCVRYFSLGFSVSRSAS
jgi:hypothetical protein